MLAVRLGLRVWAERSGGTTPSSNPGNFSMANSLDQDLVGLYTRSLKSQMGVGHCESVSVKMAGDGRLGFYILLPQSLMIVEVRDCGC